MLPIASLTFERSRTSPRRRLAVAGLLALVGVACDGAADEGSPDSPDALAATLEPENGASVTALGEGCPKGTFRLVPKDGGETYDLHFDAFYAELGEHSEVAKGCDIAIKLKDRGVSYTPVGMTFSVEPSLGKSGQGTLSSKVYWSDTSPGALTKSKTFSGTWEAGLDVSAANGLIWSTCGEPAELHVESKLAVRRSSSSGKGSAVITKLGNIRFATKACDSAVPPKEGDPSTPPTPPKPDNGAAVSITKVQTIGAGCPNGTATLKAAPDANTFVVSFGASFAVTPAARTANCTLVLDVEGPDSVQYGLGAYAASGQGTLAAGDKVTLSAYGAFGGVGGSGDAPPSTQDVVGPHSGAKLFEAAIESPNFSECGRSRSAQIRLFLTASALSEDASFRLDQFGPFELVTRRCDG